MVRFIVTVVAVCAVASATGVAAQAVGTADRGARPLSAAQFSEMRGEYQMEDGSRLTIDGVRLQPMARLDERAPVPMRASGHNRLVSADGRWLLEFQSHANGIDAVTLTMREPTR
jgi:hypothetical protein